jgi:hypothetical protein
MVFFHFLFFSGYLRLLNQYSRITRKTSLHMKRLADQEPIDGEEWPGKCSEGLECVPLLYSTALKCRLPTISLLCKRRLKDGSGPTDRHELDVMIDAITNIQLCKSSYKD